MEYQYILKEIKLGKGNDDMWWDRKLVRYAKVLCKIL